jgi:hypothetical protein
MIKDQFGELKPAKEGDQFKLLFCGPLGMNQAVMKAIQEINLPKEMYHKF